MLSSQSDLKIGNLVNRNVIL